jgi:hypothetical protein
MTMAPPLRSQKLSGYSDPGNLLSRRRDTPKYCPRPGPFDTMDDMLLNTGSQIYGYLRPQAIRQLVKDHRTGWRDYHKILFSLVVLEEWLSAISGQVNHAILKTNELTVSK